MALLHSSSFLTQEIVFHSRDLRQLLHSKRNYPNYNDLLQQQWQPYSNSPTAPFDKLHQRCSNESSDYSRYGSDLQRCWAAIFTWVAIFTCSDLQRSSHGSSFLYMVAVSFTKYGQRFNTMISWTGLYLSPGSQCNRMLSN